MPRYTQGALIDATTKTSSCTAHPAADVPDYRRGFCYPNARKVLVFALILISASSLNEEDGSLSTYTLQKLDRKVRYSCESRGEHNVRNGPQRTCR
eukprot:761646-Hanusia_phi.AAC.1